MKIKLFEEGSIGTNCFIVYDEASKKAFCVDVSDRISNKYFEFPAGTMFWARTEAVYQIFKLDLKNGVPKDVDDFLPYAIERIWLFVAKLNGFYYKRYFKYLT